MYADFLARLETAISCTVIGEETKRQLGKLLAYENANQECQRAIAPIRETGTILDYLKACCNIRSETQKMQMLAKTRKGNALRKGNERCFTCRDKNHLKRDCPKKAKTKKQTNQKNLQKSALAAIEKMHWAKECKSKFDIEGKPILGNSKQETPRSHSTKTRGKFLFPQILNIRQYCQMYQP